MINVIGEPTTRSSIKTLFFAKSNKIFNLLIFLVPISITLGEIDKLKDQKINGFVIFICNILAIMYMVNIMDMCVTQILLQIKNHKNAVLINAIFNNSIEVIIGIVALLKGGLVVIVQATCLGSILCNLMLVLGCSLLVEGFKFSTSNKKKQIINRNQVGKPIEIITSLILTVSAFMFILPGILGIQVGSTVYVNGKVRDLSILEFSRAVSVMLFISYLSYLFFFQMKIHKFYYKMIFSSKSPSSLSLSLSLSPSSSSSAISKIETVTTLTPIHITTTKNNQKSHESSMKMIEFMKNELLNYPTKDNSADIIIQRLMDEGITTFELLVKVTEGMLAVYGMKGCDILNFKQKIEEKYKQIQLEIEKENEKEKEEEEEESMLIILLSFRVAVIGLIITTVLIGICVGYLLNSVERISFKSGFSELFIGTIVFPVVCNASKHMRSISLAMKDKLNVSIGISIASSVQMLLGVTSFLVLFGWAIGQPMNLNYGVYDITVMFLSVLIVDYIIRDGTNWYEGLILVICYICVAVGFFYFKPLQGNLYIYIYIYIDVCIYY
jgi:Ca2+:H+ antiporter